MSANKLARGEPSHANDEPLLVVLKNRIVAKEQNIPEEKFAALHSVVNSLKHPIASSRILTFCYLAEDSQHGALKPHKFQLIKIRVS